LEHGVPVSDEQSPAVHSPLLPGPV